jgi:phenylacetic acid degradation operon negative regulatory protein
MSPTRNAPLTARSILASVLLGSDPPWLPTSRLVRTGSLFGVAEGTVRTALSRMTSTGELVAEDGGYRLVGRLVERQARQAASRRADVRDWDGTWELATVSGDRARSAADRADLRDALRALRLAELREGVWGRPDNLDADRSPEAASVVARWCTRWSGATPDPAPVVDSLWPLRAWRSEAGELHTTMAALLDRLEAGDARALADGFVISAAALRLFQRDPLLPAALLGPDWPGVDLRRDYEPFDLAYRAALRSWFRQEA